MLRSILFALLVVVGTSLSSCTEDSQRVFSEPLTYKDTTVTFHPPGCTGTVDSCGGIEFSYPIFSGGDSIVTKALNDSIHRYSMRLYTETPTELAVTARMMFEEYAEFKREVPESPMMWNIDVDVTVSCIDSVVSIRIDDYRFLGGAHPNNWTSFINYDLYYQKFINAESMLADSLSVLRQAESAFRIARGLTPTESFSEAGFDFQDGFALADNIGFVKDSIVLVYNAYEVGPYVMGPTEFALKRPRLELVPETITENMPGAKPGVLPGAKPGVLPGTTRGF